MVTSIVTMSMLRYVASLNIFSLINSISHRGEGKQPYDQSGRTVDSLFLNIITLGDGSHNYHHTFPWDYRGSKQIEWFNAVGRFIHVCATLGMAYDLKSASDDLINKRMERASEFHEKMYTHPDLIK